MMKFSRLFLCSALLIGLSGCLAIGSSAKSSPEPVIIKVNKGKTANAQTFQLYVGSTQKGDLKTTSQKGKKKTTTVVKQDVEVVSGNVVYYTTGAIVHNQDIRNVFVAKTIAGDPALGIRLSPEANTRLSQALSLNKAGTVLASLNDSVFSKVNNAGAKLQDGVLLLPMHSLNEARDVANLLRKK